MYSRRFQEHLYDESALSRFEVLTKPIYICNKDHPYYATQYQDIFIQYQEGFYFVSRKTSPDFDDIHITIPGGPPSLIPSSFDKNHNYTTNQKNTNCLENKIGLALFTLMSRPMQNSIT